MKQFAQIAIYLIVTGQDGSPNPVFLTAEQTILLEVEDVMKSPAALLAMHALLIQIITSPARHFTLYCSLQTVLLASTSIKMTISFSSLLAYLK